MGFQAALVIVVESPNSADDVKMIFAAIKDVKLTRKLQAWERSASTGDRVADLKALDSLDPPPAKKCRHEDEDDEPAGSPGTNS